MTDWGWLEMVDPKTIERERFNVTARTVKRREGVQLGSLATMPAEDVRIIQAVARERQREIDQREAVEEIGVIRGEVRALEAQLARERREHERALAWQKKLSTLGRSQNEPARNRSQAPETPGLSRTQKGAA
jgi:hypothetical protein